MKYRTRNLTAATFGLAAMLTAPLTHAADVTWDTAPGTVGAGDSSITGGAGTWDITNGNWTIDGGVNNVAWNNANNDAALFTGTAGTVTLGANVTVSGLEFLAAGYTLSGGANTITLANNGGKREASSPGPSILFDQSGTATVDANIDNNGFLLTIVADRSGGRNVVVSGVISGSGGLATYESVNATLSGANTYTGKTQITADTTSGSTLSVSSLNSVAVPAQMPSSSLGVPADAAAGTIEIGNTGKQASCSLIYTGTGETTDRVIAFRMNGNGRDYKIENNGTGLLKFTSQATHNGSTAGDVRLAGSNDGEFELGIPSGPRNLEKIGTGTWTLGGTNEPDNTIVSAGNLTVTGTLGGESTTVSGGTLSLGDGTNNASLSDSSAVTVSGSGMINLNYSSGSPDSVFVLIIGGTTVPAGNYGATASGADNGGAGVGAYDAVFTGTGIITTAGGLLPAGDFQWDGGVADIGSDGNAASNGGTGTWDATIQNWDVGYTAHTAWGNTTSDTATFGGSTGTVTLGADLNIGTLNIEVPNGNGTPYSIGDPAEDNTLTFGGAATINSTATGNGNKHQHIIHAGIAGSPTVNVTGANDNNDNHFNLLPPSGVTMTLGTLNMFNTFGSNKRLLLGGSSNGNVVDEITWTVTNNQLWVRKTDDTSGGADGSSWTITQNYENRNPGPGGGDSKLSVEEGTLIFAGTYNTWSHKCEVQSGGRLSAQGDWDIYDPRNDFEIQGGGIVSPGGSSVDTLTITWSESRGDTAEVDLQSGSTYEWQVGAGNTTDVIAINETVSPNLTLIVDATTTIKVMDAGGTPSSGDQLTVFTYSADVTTPDTATLNANMTIDISGTSYTGTPSFVNDGAGTIYITGIDSGGAGAPYDTWSGGFGGLTDPTATVDFDLGGLQTGIEWVVGGDPSAPGDDAGNAPTVSEDATYLIFTYNRRDDAEADANTAIKVEWDVDLQGAWTEAIAGDGVVFTVTDGSPFDSVEVKIPKSLAAPGTELYARLNVTITP